MIKKRILILANNSGGLYRFRKELMIALIEKGYEVFVSTPFDDNVDDLKSIRVNLIKTSINRRGMNPLKDFKLLLSYYKIIKRVKPDLVITYTIKPNLYGGTVCRLLKTPFAVNITGLGTAFQHDGLLKKFVSFWYKSACKKVKVVFFENQGNRDVFLNNSIVDINKCHVLNGAGVNLEDFPFNKYPEINDKLHFLFIGRIMKEKGVDELFEAIERLHKEKYSLVLDVLGNYEDDYESKVNDLTKKGIINYFGYQNDVKPFIEQCHCFVLPSYHEGMANTLLECAAMGRPLITSDIHGCKEAVNNNGYLCNVKDVDDLYCKIKTFIELDDDMRKEMGIQSRKHIEEVFDKKKVVEETMKGLGI